MTRWLGVALLPSAEHTRSAVQLQTDVGEDHGLQPPLSPDGNLPHVTVFQGPFLDSLSPERELRTIAGSMSLPEEIRLASTGIVYQPTGWVFLSLERPTILSELQAAVLSVLAPHLDRAAFDTSKDTSRFTPDERASFAEYGYRYTGDAYAPHITLGRAEEDIALKLVGSAPERTSVQKEWTFDRLTFYVMGEHGAHAEKLVERSLDPA
ncbi:MULTISPECIES: 2'-5' RNA ligase family protein [unclassified Streptomyces]|uniref:2'-5' RNA ligase family protein n=1 Tax=unclassified Streptomyces TaxID=2593676 RepID=UPI0033B8B4D6|nr:2'-5' RNA ligase family protein [Streptomyces sp. NBC_01653]WTD92347.1 2'-5' RNA ligase family protein [Streptomyces sp. NBC_01637]